MRNVKTYIYKDIKALNKGFTDFLKENIFSTEEKINIALSGGSTPTSLYNYWGTECKDKIEWNNIRFFWGDERCVSPNNPLSNYGVAKETFLDRIKIPSENIFRIEGERNPQEEAVRYGQVLNDELPSHNDIPIFDLIILGLGEDGHTASIFPEQIEMWDSKGNCIVTHHPDTKASRISITGKIINNARHTVFLVTGKNKSKRIKEILQEEDIARNKYPAAKVETKNLYWFMDEDAAHLL